MRGVGVTVFIRHGFRVSMVGRDQYRTAHGLNFFHDFANTFIHGLASTDGCVQKSGMADHVHVGKIEHHQMVRGFIQPGQ